MWSDHRPVSASLLSEIRVVDEEKRKLELASVMKELDRLDEVYRPSLETGSTHVEFGDVR
jgi:phosphatidylinositol-bisphosphatase